VSQAANGSPDPIKQLRKEMGFWDALLFSIATVLGPRWVAAAAHNGTSSISGCWRRCCFSGLRQW